MTLTLFVSVVPHVTDAVQEWVERVAHIPVDGDKRTPDCCIIEVAFILLIASASLVTSI